MNNPNYQQLAHELAEAKSQIAEYEISLGVCYDAVETINNLTEKCLDHPDAPEHRIWRKGLLQALARLQQTIAELIEEPEDTNE